MQCGIWPPPCTHACCRHALWSMPGRPACLLRALTCKPASVHVRCCKHTSHRATAYLLEAQLFVLMPRFECMQSKCPSDTCAMPRCRDNLTRARLTSGRPRLITTARARSHVRKPAATMHPRLQRLLSLLICQRRRSHLHTMPPPTTLTLAPPPHLPSWRIRRLLPPVEQMRHSLMISPHR